MRLAAGSLGGYAAQGFTLTLRQLYYQFVARDLLANTLAEYKRLGRIICDGRDGGLIDWHAIEDRTREVHIHASWDKGTIQPRLLLFVRPLRE